MLYLELPCTWQKRISAVLLIMFLFPFLAYLTKSLFSCTLSTPILQNLKNVRILYTSGTTKDGNFYIYLMDLDGSNKQKLVPFRSMYPSLSPNGNKLALVSNRSGKSKIWLMNLKTQKLRMLTNIDLEEVCPSFSPNGKEICFCATIDGNADIYLVNNDGTELRRLTRHEAGDSCPSWSPNGEEIVFSSSRDSEAGWSSQVYKMNKNGEGLTKLTNFASKQISTPTWPPLGAKLGSFQCLCPKWSPKGDKIAFCFWGGGAREICMLYLKENKTKIITSNIKAGSSLSWTPDGNQIVFSSNKDGASYELYIMDSDGSNVKRLTSSPEFTWNRDPSCVTELQ